MKNKYKKNLLSIMIISIISLFLTKYSYIAIIINSICIILSLTSLKSSKRIPLLIIIISILSIITNLIILYQTNNNKDKYEGINIILGSWTYNEHGGIYTFKEDNTYIQYFENDKTTNYCQGKYEYTYGGISKDQTIIKEDKNFYYYNISLKEDYCNINNIDDYSKYQKNLIFALGKNNNEKLLINPKTQAIYNIKKTNSP